MPGAGKLQRIVVKGPVTLTRGADERVTSDAAEFDTAQSKAVLSGSVVMTSGADRRAVADRADIDSSASTALLTGTVVVTSGKNELKGRSLFIDNKAQRMQLTAPGGRITAHFVQGERKEKPHKAAGAAPAAGFATFKTDPDAPVDIEADALDANDAAKTATFRGNVKAVQGGFTIRTPEMVAGYSGEAGLGAPGGEKPSAAKPPAQLTRIEARKKVTVTSSEGQTVNGDWAIFDAASSTVTVGGDVLLSQGKNVVRGTRLVIDMRTGASTIETAGGVSGVTGPGEGWAAHSPEGPGGTAKQGRPSAVFYPDQLRAMRGEEGSAKKPQGGSAGSWEASTKP
jgi:lipopolysaccharide transport protein LptA